jgi:hypothetical protein
MKDVHITPNQMFKLIGSTLSQSIINNIEDNKQAIVHQVQIAKLNLEMSIEITPGLKLSHLPSNQNLKLDGHSKKAYFKIKVAAY